MTDGEQTKEMSGAQVGCMALALVIGSISVMQIVGSHYSSVEGWTLLCLALNFGHSALTYRRSEDVVYRASRRRLVFILGICTLPPLLLLFFFGDRSGWQPWLVAFFLVSLSLGPVVLLRRFRQRSENALGAKNG